MEQFNKNIQQNNRDSLIVLYDTAACSISMQNQSYKNKKAKTETTKIIKLEEKNLIKNLEEKLNFLLKENNELMRKLKKYEQEPIYKNFSLSPSRINYLKSKAMLGINFLTYFQNQNNPIDLLIYFCGKLPEITLNTSDEEIIYKLHDIIEIALILKDDFNHNNYIINIDNNVYSSFKSIINNYQCFIECNNKKYNNNSSIIAICHINNKLEKKKNELFNIIENMFIIKEKSKKQNMNILWDNQQTIITQSSAVNELLKKQFSFFIKNGIFSSALQGKIIHNACPFQKFIEQIL